MMIFSRTNAKPNTQPNAEPVAAKPFLNDLDRIMVNQLVIMNALRLAAPDGSAAKDLAYCINRTIEHNHRIDFGIQKVWSNNP